MDNHILEGALQLGLLEIQVGPLRCISRGSYMLSVKVEQRGREY